jgi:tripartite-type tricarboxylate transporter receptor subunit TctC
MTRFRLLLAATCTCLPLLVAAQPAAAQAFPSKPVTLVVPFAAGGPSDALGRVIAQAMSGPLGQQMVVENIGGAGGTIGAARGAAARPDGYTVLLTHIGQATSLTLYRKLPYHPVEAFETVGMVGEVPMTIVGRKDLPVKDARELFTFIKANGNKLTFGNAGVGSASHLCGLLFMSRLQTEMNVIPFKGSGPALIELLGGRIDLQCDQTTTTTNHIRSGAIRGYGVSMPSRVPTLPDLPTLAESGLAEFELAVWYGLLVPRGTPRPVVERLAAAMKAASADVAYLKRLEEFGVQPVPAARSGPDGFAAYFRAEAARWAPVIKAAGVFAD